MSGETCRIGDFNLSTLDMYLKGRFRWPTSDDNKLPLVVVHTFSSAVHDAAVCAEIPGTAWGDQTRCTITFF